VAALHEATVDRSAYRSTMRFDFQLRNLAGSVDVTVVPNDDPEVFGCRPTARGFPVCTAEVAYEGRGYAAMLGWIQLVRSTDNASGGRDFEVDPYEPLGTSCHPFCWFGLTPTLFDAPSRPTLARMEWLAHSFLSFIGQPREVRTILGFSWGFAIDRGKISLTGPASLAPSAWDEQRPLLHRTYPSWRFASGYRRE
jgi:hypothetical protein